MTRSAARARAELAEWRTESLRLTTFHDASVQLDAAAWWQRFVGQEPESKVEKPREGECVIVGPHAEAQLQLLTKRTGHSGRIDWILLQRPDVPELEADTLDRKFASFVELMHPWMADCPAPTRFALGVVALLPVSDRRAGYFRLSDYLNFDLDPDHSSDFVYQINRKRKSSVVAGLELNRLMTWSGLLRTQFGLSVEVQGTVARLGPPTEPETGHFCRVAIDINSVPEYTGPLPANHLPALFDEFVELAKEIVREGDIA